jgi:AcrR family transcriptional regulator
MQRREGQTVEAHLDPAVRQRIVAAARKQFFAHGFRSVTMDDLAEGLGMSKKTLYAHFPSKTALLEAMLLDKFHNVAADLEAISSECSENFAEGLHRLLTCVKGHTEEIGPPFIRDIQREAPELFQVVQARRREVIQRYFSKLLGEGRREGLIRKDVPIHLIIEILLGAVDTIMIPPRMVELGLTPKGGFTAIITVILEGALTPEGRSKL